MIGASLRTSERRFIESYALTASDLAIYRMLYAAFVLVAVVPDAAPSRATAGDPKTAAR